MLPIVKTVLPPPAASAVVVIDVLAAASLTDISRITGNALSTVQRAVHSLTDAGVLTREWDRGPFSFSSNAPAGALRELAQWALGPDLSLRLVEAARTAAPEESAPATITNPRIRRAWSPAIERLVSRHHPNPIVLFGSQARGDAESGSDVDLLVVFDRVSDRRQKRVAIRRTLADMPFAKDVLVASTADLAQPPSGTALAEAIRDGFLVYQP